MEIVEGLNDAEKGEIKEHFNNLIEGEEGLGDVLFEEDADNLGLATNVLDERGKKTYADELQNEFIDIN